MRWGVIAITLVFFLTACAPQDQIITEPRDDTVQEPDDVEETVPTEEPTMIGMPVPGEDGDEMIVEEESVLEEPSVKEFNIEAFRYEFNPNTIRVNEGDHIRLVFTSLDVVHGVSIPEYGIKTPPFNEGETQVLDFIADKTGEFPFRCNVMCGSGHSHMTGVLIVE